MEEMKKLIQKLNEASKAYYQLAAPIMSDYEYDKLYDRLCRLEQETGIIMANSPTQNVGYTVLSSLEKIKHDKKMLSLDKTKDIEKLKSWLGDKEGLLSWKLDGLTIILKYAGGKLVQAVTRGNGEIGEDITHNAKVFQNIPLSISFPEALTLRGEGIISFTEFERINSLLPDEEKYKNPRNLCSGTVRQLNSQVAAERKVLFYAFTLVQAEGISFDTKKEQLDWLSSLGFTPVEHQIVTEASLEQTVQAFEKAIPHNDFAADGLVLTYNSIAYSESLGETAKFPRDSIAFKWADETAETILERIEWNTSRTGLINPIAVFDPVELEGTTVNRASVHNVSVLRSLKLGIGDTIKVYKANMIIPQIAENITCSNTAEIPAHCPVCGGETEIRKLREGEALYCTNPTCQAQTVQALSHYASRSAMNIEGLSEETIKKFVEKGFLLEYPDIYTLSQYKEQMIEMSGFGEKSFQNLMASIERSKEVSLPNFIFALGINHVGLSNARLLCEHYQYDLNQIKEAKEEELVGIYGFGEVIAHSVYQYFHTEKHLFLLDKALKYLLLRQPQAQETGEDAQALSGLTFVITGDLIHFANRKELQELIETKGGKVTGSVTKKTSYLINNDRFSTSSKNKKANELNIPILTEEEFMKKYAINKG